MAWATGTAGVVARADLAARLAGDEFVLLLTGLDAWYQRLSDRFLNEMSAAGLDLQTGLSASQTWLGNGGGFAQSGPARADRALYGAKARGRGQLVQDAAPAAE